MRSYARHLFTRKVRAIGICGSLAALVSLFSLWPGSVGLAKKAMRSSSNSFAAIQAWTEKAVASTAVGNTITVNSTSDLVNGTDGLCTLREAITAANSNTASGAAAGECVAGSSSGSDTIDLTGLTGTITLTSVLPNISSDVTINGPGTSGLTIQRSTSNFSIFNVDSSATVNISGLTIQGGTPQLNSSGVATLQRYVESYRLRGKRLSQGRLQQQSTHAHHIELCHQCEQRGSC